MTRQEKLNEKLLAWCKAKGYAVPWHDDGLYLTRCWDSDNYRVVWVAYGPRQVCYFPLDNGSCLELEQSPGIVQQLIPAGVVEDWLCE